MLLQGGADDLAPADLHRDKQSALNALTDIAGSAKKDGVGPVSVGNVKDFPEHLKEVVSVYRLAFLSGVQSFPYLVG